MNLESLLYFQCLATEKNFTRAANRLHITQQALSGQISRLEKQYGVQLIIREPLFQLTYAGERFLAYSRQVYNWYTQIGEELRDIRDGERGQIHVGATAKRGYSILPLVMPEFHNEYPNIEVCMHEGNSQIILTDLISGKTDFCISVSDIDDPNIYSMKLSEEQTILFIADSLLHRYCTNSYIYLLNNKDKQLPISYFKDCPFLMNGPQNRIRISCDRLFESNKIIPNIVFSTTNTLNLAEMAKLGIGAAFMSSSTRNDTVQGLHRFMIEGLSEPQVVKINWLGSHHLSQAALRFIEIAHKNIPNNAALPQSSLSYF